MNNASISEELSVNESKSLKSFSACSFLRFHLKEETEYGGLESTKSKASF
jgi:hypothetical protein